MLVPASRLETEVTVRAFFDEGGQFREVGGADCRLVAGDFAAAFRSPARVVVPIPPFAAPPLEASCAAAGRAGAARTPLLRRWMEPYPPGWGSWRDQYPWAWGFGGPGLGYGFGPWRGGWVGPGPYGVFYPDLTVRMR